jgi:hypothetical protein
LGSGVVGGVAVVVDVDVDTVLPARAAAIWASSAARTGSTVPVVFAVFAVLAVSVGAAGGVEALSAELAGLLLDEPDCELVFVPLFVVAAGGEEFDAADDLGGVAGGADDEDDALVGAGACAGAGGGAGGAGGAGGGLGGAAASIRAENGVWGTLLGTDRFGGEKLGGGLGAGGGAGDATADTKLTSNQELTPISLQSPGQPVVEEKLFVVSGLRKVREVCGGPAGNPFRIARQELPGRRGRARTLRRRRRFL